MSDPWLDGLIGRLFAKAAFLVVTLFWLGDIHMGVVESRHGYVIVTIHIVLFAGLLLDELLRWRRHVLLRSAIRRKVDHREGIE